MGQWTPAAPPGRAPGLRIIGGRLRGRPLEYSGDPRTRPMKDNVREATFNLVGGWAAGKHALDLFAGTGALGLEAISRGANHATLIERHIPTARIIRRNTASLGVTDQTTVVTSDTFFWARQWLQHEQEPNVPWMVFCSPPYRLYRDQQAEMLELIGELLEASPPHSVLVVESDESFSANKLPSTDQWRVRQYAPIQLCVFRK